MSCCLEVLRDGTHACSCDSDKKVVHGTKKIKLKCGAITTQQTPLLDRRGAETKERSEFVEAGWWN
jgi:hypothetical protein